MTTGAAGGGIRTSSRAGVALEATGRDGSFPGGRPGTSLDDYDLWPPPEPVEVVPTPRKHRHDWLRTPRVALVEGSVRVVDGPPLVECRRCGATRDEVKARRGKQSRNYGNRAELAVAKKYGGTNVGKFGGPVDVRGAEFNVQVKTHRRLPPAEWRTAFGGMNANLERIPRLLLRFLPGPGLPPDDYFVMRADDWLRWFGRDE